MKQKTQRRNKENISNKNAIKQQKQKQHQNNRNNKPEPINKPTIPETKREKETIKAN